MGAGKSTLGREVAERLGRPFVDLDEAIAAEAGMTIAQIFARHGEVAFRAREEEEAAGALGPGPPLVVALGGGAVTSARTRALLREHATTVLVDVDPATAWDRVQGGDRPLAQDEESFRTLYEERAALYREVADAVVRTADDTVLAAAGISVGLGLLERLGELVPGDGPLALVSDSHVAGIYGAQAQLSLGARLVSSHTVPAGEEAKTVSVCERVWRELTLDRRGTLVGLGGGCTTDVAGFVAAGYLRGIAWVAVPTTLVGQVDAAIGGKTGIDLPTGKNLVGAFHWPARTVIDPVVLETLPERERRQGMAEVVKTGLLAGEPLWSLPDAELVRRCAAFKAGICLRDPRDQGERAMLNLGHTFAHALEAGSGYSLSHGDAVALGVVAALRLSVEHLGLDRAVLEQAEQALGVTPVPADPERAWSALALDKKSVGGSPRLVLLEALGRPRLGVELPEADVRRALESLIA